MTQHTIRAIAKSDRAQQLAAAARYEARRLADNADRDRSETAADLENLKGGPAYNRHHFWIDRPSPVLRAAIDLANARRRNVSALRTYRAALALCRALGV